MKIKNFTEAEIGALADDYPSWTDAEREKALAMLHLLQFIYRNWPEIHDTVDAALRLQPRYEKT